MELRQNAFILNRTKSSYKCKNCTFYKIGNILRDFNDKKEHGRSEMMMIDADYTLKSIVLWSISSMIAFYKVRSYSMEAAFGYN